MEGIRKLKDAFSTPFKYRKVTIKDQVRAAKKEQQTSKGLFDLISRAEGTHGNYNAFYGNGKNDEVKFTEMTINDVLSWQERFVRNGSPSSAIGKYQIIQDTLAETRDKMGLTGDELFDEETQEKMGEYLLDKKRGYSKWKSGKLSDQQFANNLAMEWASFPVLNDQQGHRGFIKRGQSYYAGDGLNKALISPDEILQALENDRRKLSDTVGTA